MLKSEFYFVPDLNKMYLELCESGLGPDDFLVFDQRVYEIYHSYFSQHPERNIFKIPSGEQAKTWPCLQTLLENFFYARLTRSHKVIAIGGGATSDLVGLASSLALRGVQWWVVPTTLLAQVDASIGGKTAINSQQAKNLIGSFHLPQKIFFCEKFLDTLPHDEMKSGKGEVLKYSFLSHLIADEIDRASAFELNHLVKLCAEYKSQIVAADLREDNTRAQLNLGHTFGHALEQYYSWSHGIAISYGLWLKILLFCPQLDEVFVGRSKNLNLLLERSQLLKAWREREGWWPILLQDKKRCLNQKLSLILPTLLNGYEPIEVEAQTLKMQEL